MVWQPDIVLLNNADGNYEVMYKANIVSNESGLVEWIPPAIYQSTCPIDVRYFPFDQQTCAMKFASWTFTANEVPHQLIYIKMFFIDSDHHHIFGSLKYF